MRSILALVIGGLLAFAIACGGGGKPTGMMPPPPGPRDVRAELERLDQAITADMQALSEPRPAPPVAACVENCATQMSGAAKVAAADDATCKPGAGEACTSSCKLKTSICANASKICSIASDLGGKYEYANETCNRGAASCEAAKKRCCSCI